MQADPTPTTPIDTSNAGTHESAAQAQSALAADVSQFSQNLQEFINNPTWSSFAETFLPILLDVGRIIAISVILLVVVSFLARWASRAAETALKRTQIEATLRVFLTRMVKYAVWVLAVPVALSVLGIQATSLAAVIGAAGLAIGLGLQGALANISAGILLLLLRPIRIGDVVNIQGVGGEVTELGLFYTILNTFENEPVHIPNQQILTDKVRNLTGNDTRRIVIPVGVAYGTDLHQAESIILNAIKSVEHRAEHDATAVFLTAFGASSIDFVAHIYCPNRKFLPVRHAAIHAINDALKAANIEIPFPQRTLSGNLRLVQSDTKD
jgi:small conductance mechanosensitive channel